MTESVISLWSKTASSNASADAAINWAEGMAPSAVNNSGRSMMAAIAKWRDDFGGAVISTGASNEYTITTNSGIAAHANGVFIAFRADKTCTAACTTTIDGLAQKSILRADGSATAAGDIVSGGIYLLAYSSTAGHYLAVNVGSNTMASLTDGDSWTAVVTVASAATCDILGAASDFIAISGTATITSLGTGINKIRFVRATGAFTLTHNASSLILPGGANIVATNGDTFIVISDASSNARIFAYQPSAPVINTVNGQYVFPASQNASANANTLDDYEEGSWTPTMKFNNSATGVTYGTQTGVYVKIGALVYVRGRVTLTNNGSGVGNASIEGLPFTMPAGADASAQVGYYNNTSSVTGALFGFLGNTGSNITVMHGGAAAATFATDTTLTNTFDIVFSAVYSSP